MICFAHTLGFEQIHKPWSAWQSAIGQRFAQCVYWMDVPSVQ
jgi:hypothetical protein